MTKGRRTTPHERGARALGAALLAALLLACPSCSEMGSNDASTNVEAPDTYTFGGQTGSLVPGCGVAPLSAAGRSVPEGDAIAVVYARECPEELALARLELEGMAGPVQLELVPLETGGAFLVRAGQSLAAGDYRLSLGASADSELRVGGEAPALPQSLGPLRLVPALEACPDRLQFELTLDDAALAYAPLSRFSVNIDSGPEQLWVDYGALRVESDASGSRGLLDLPRCAAATCLEPGAHGLTLHALIAGEELQPAPLELGFDVDCPSLATFSAVDDSSSSRGCSVARGAAGGGLASALGSVACLTWAALRRRGRRKVQRSRSA